MTIYFVTEEACCSSSYIKVGYTNNVQRRIKQLQTANPRKLKLMGRIEDSDRKFEKKLQRKHQNFLYRGEWFVLPASEVLSELKQWGSQAYISTQENVGDFLGCDKDAVPEYLGAWEWLDTDIKDFCPQCGWGGGVHYNSASDSETCLKCGYPIFD